MREGGDSNGVGDEAGNDNDVVGSRYKGGCLSFLADTKSNESALNLCFTMPVTFYFTSFVSSKLKNYLPYSTVALST